jgi:hypothetical protein
MSFDTLIPKNALGRSIAIASLMMPLDLGVLAESTDTITADLSTQRLTAQNKTRVEIRAGPPAPQTVRP